MTIGFRDHEGFHRAAIGMAVAGGAAGIAMHLAWSGPLAAPVAGAIGAALGLGWAARSRRAARTGLGLIGVAAGGAAAVGLGGWLGVAALATCTAIGLHAGTPTRRWAVGSIVGALFLFAGAFAALRIVGAAATATWPAWITMALAGAAMAAVAVGAVLPAHVAIERDAVGAACRALPATVDVEVAELVTRGAAVWTEVKDRLPAADPGRALIRDGVLRMVEVATRSQHIPRDLPAQATRIEARIDELDARLAAATDELARAQYDQARSALDDQRRYLATIQTARERLVARMHNYLTALETFRLAVIKLESASAATLAAEARPALAQVADLGADLASCGEALAELEAPAAAAA